MIDKQLIEGSGESNGRAPARLKAKKLVKGAASLPTYPRMPAAVSAE